jgi:hypothetical protein
MVFHIQSHLVMMLIDHLGSQIRFPFQKWLAQFGFINHESGDIASPSAVTVYEVFGRRLIPAKPLLQ